MNVIETAKTIARENLFQCARPLDCAAVPVPQGAAYLPLRGSATILSSDF
jgi:hypothetical protein